MFSSSKNKCWRTRQETLFDAHWWIHWCACAAPMQSHIVEQQSWQNYWFHSLPFQQFQALFNSLFKVLFIFPSWYLFAIGLKSIFSFRWNLPPTLRSNSKERDSEKACRTQRIANDLKDSHPQWCSFPRSLQLHPCWQYFARLQFKARGPNFHAEPIPVHSPLLRESCLVSFPPLTYMLKFSGSASLTSCHERQIVVLRCRCVIVEKLQ